MKLSSLLLAGAAMLVSTGAQAQVSGLYNTGVNNSGALLAQGAVDPHYTVGGASTFAYNPGSYGTAASGETISRDGTASPLGTLSYSTTFTLSNVSLLGAKLTGSFLADNHVTGYLNNSSFGTVDEYDHFVDFTATSLVLGLNTLRFDVTNDGGPAGLGVANLAVSASPVAAVPEPAAWAMMILGMGAIGFAMRRRKVTTRVSYAA